jgi:putative nucleotidyltransferase with HDIG domain
VTVAGLDPLRRPLRLRRVSLGPLSPGAWLYWAAVVGPALAAFPLAAVDLDAKGADWRRFVLLALLASLSQLLSFHVNRRRVFHTGLAFTVAAALLLPPELVIAVCAVQHLPEWLRQKYPWFIQTFNIANYMLAGLAAWEVVHAVGFPASPAREAAAGALAAGVFVAANRLLLLPMLYLGRGLTPSQTGLLDVEDTSLELVLALMAVPLAVLWLQSMALALLALAPLFVVHLTQRAMLRLEDASAEIDEAHQEVMQRSTAALEALSATVDARDKYTAGHSRRVSAFSTAIAQHLGLAADEVETVGQAALLHDIGKIAVPDSVLLKPAELTQTEETIMRSHPEEGARIIERLGYLDEVVPGIRHHHERLDGRGYPDGLLGDEIPLSARIIHVADALDAMTTARVYRDALSFDAAIGEIRRSRGTDFCETCVDALELALAADIGPLARGKWVAA